MVSLLTHSYVAVSVSKFPWFNTTGLVCVHTYSAAVTTLTDTACTYSGYSGPRGGVAA